MKKTRFQPTFASLTEAELEQLAAAVQRETYDAVRERICKPRSQGGLDLHFTSNSPLVRLHDKKNKLDLINTRLSAQSPEQRKLSLADLNTFISLEKPRIISSPPNARASKNAPPKTNPFPPPPHERTHPLFYRF